MIIMHPDDIAGLYDFENFLAESFIDENIFLPVFFIIDGEIREVMEEGPECFIAEAFVKFIRRLFRKKDRKDAEFFQNFRADFFLIVGIDRRAWPADPED